MRFRALATLLFCVPGLLLPPGASARICLCRGVLASILAAEEAACCGLVGDETADSGGALCGACLLVMTVPDRDPAAPPEPAAQAMAASAPAVAAFPAPDAPSAAPPPVPPRAFSEPHPPRLAPLLI